MRDCTSGKGAELELFSRWPSNCMRFAARLKHILRRACSVFQFFCCCSWQVEVEISLIFETEIAYTVEAERRGTGMQKRYLRCSSSITTGCDRSR